MRVVATALALGALLVTAGGCVTTSKPIVRASLVQLEARSAFDLGCSYRELSLYHFDDRTKGVTGCGRRLTYVEDCRDLGTAVSCSWVLNSPPGGVDATSSRPAPPPPAGASDHRSAQAPAAPASSGSSHLPGSLFGPPDPGF
jgi:hypothetical protein